MLRRQGLGGLQEPDVAPGRCEAWMVGGKRPGGAGFFAEDACEEEDEVEGQGFTKRRRG